MVKGQWWHVSHGRHSKPNTLICKPSSMMMCKNGRREEEEEEEEGCIGGVWAKDWKVFDDGNVDT